MIDGSLEHGGRELTGWVCTPTWELVKAFLEEVTACASQSVKEIPGRRSHVVEIRGEKEPTYLRKGVKRQS